jgi:hypothetical protein
VTPDRRRPWWVLGLVGLTVVSAGLVQWLGSPPAAVFFWPASAAVAATPFVWRDRLLPWAVAGVAGAGFAICQVVASTQAPVVAFGTGAGAAHLGVALHQWAGWDVPVLGAALLLAVARSATTAASAVLRDRSARPS